MKLKKLIAYPIVGAFFTSILSLIIFYIYMLVKLTIESPLETLKALGVFGIVGLVWLVIWWAISQLDDK